jgi:hypothetical protein
MGWLNFRKAGASSTPQADDTETLIILETGERSYTLPYDITIVDVVLDKPATQNHQYRFYVNGRAQGANFYSGQINPSTQGRLNWANQRIVIPKGSTLQIKGSQKTGTSAEETIVLVQFIP